MKKVNGVSLLQLAQMPTHTEDDDDASNDEDDDAGDVDDEDGDDDGGGYDCISVAD